MKTGGRASCGVRIEQHLYDRAPSLITAMLSLLSPSLRCEWQVRLLKCDLRKFRRGTEFELVGVRSSSFFVRS